MFRDQYPSNILTCHPKQFCHEQTFRDTKKAKEFITSDGVSGSYDDEQQIMITKKTCSNKRLSTIIIRRRTIAGTYLIRRTTIPFQFTFSARFVCGTFGNNRRSGNTSERWLCARRWNAPQRRLCGRSWTISFKITNTFF